jgi:3'-phosphoadenosine 5'-phosphosulfate sulfotransferase (PAPS reductase)/FAD synthetase
MSSINIPKEADDHEVIASVSGGKDSTAMVLALKERGIPFRMAFADTGWEAEETYAYLDVIERAVGQKIDRVGRPGGMLERAKHLGTFPARLQRWCTQDLKVKPLREYHDRVSLGCGRDTISAIGIRSDESQQRANAAEFEDDARWGGFVWRPLIHWTVEDVIKMHKKHAVPMNPLYHMGFNRVGCFPCIYTTKDEIRMVAEHAPERIDLIREAESELTDLRRVRNEEKPGRYKHPVATFFLSRAGAVGIDGIVAWSRTDRGGRQLPLLAPPPAGGCMRWGMCEPPPSAHDSEDGGGPCVDPIGVRRANGEESDA